MSNIPKVSINDLIQSANNSTNMIPSAQMTNQPNANNPVANFISTLAKYAHQGVSDVGSVLDHTPISQAPSSPSIGQVGRDFVKGYQNPAAMPTSLAGGVGAIVGMPDPLNPKADLNAVNDASQGIKETLLGGKTAEEIKAAKAAGLPKIINGAQDTPDMINTGILDSKGNPIMRSNIPQTATGKANTPLHLSAEKLPPDAQTPQGASIPQKPYPDVPDQPAIVTDRTGTHPVTNGNPVLVDLRNEAKNNPYYLSDQTKSRAVMDKYVAGNTPLEVEQNLPLQLTEESQRIKNIIASNPTKTANIADLVAQNETNLQKAGISPGTSSSADTATREALHEFDNQIGNQAAIPGKTEASGEDLVNYKNILDDKLKSAYKKADNGGALTPGENAMRTLRRTINDQLKQMYPGVGDALDRQSAMMDARPSVAKAAGAEEKAQTDAAQAAIQKANAPKEPGFFKKHATAIGLTTLAGLTSAGVGGAVYGLPKIAAINNAAKQTTDLNTLPSFTPYAVKTPLDDGSVLSDSQYQNEKAKQQAIMDKTALTDPTGAYAQAKAAYDKNETDYTSQQDIRNESANMKNLQDNANSASIDLRKVDLGFFNALSKGYNSADIQNNPNYAGLAADLQNLSNATTMKLDQATNKKALQEGIDKAILIEQRKLQKMQYKYSPQTNSASTPTPPQQAPTGLPPIQQNHIKWQPIAPGTQAILNQSLTR